MSRLVPAEIVAALLAAFLTVGCGPSEGERRAERLLQIISTSSNASSSPKSVKGGAVMYLYSNGHPEMMRLFCSKDDMIPLVLPSEFRPESTSATSCLTGNLIGRAYSGDFEKHECRVSIYYYVASEMGAAREPIEVKAQCA